MSGQCLDEAVDDLKPFRFTSALLSAELVTRQAPVPADLMVLKLSGAKYRSFKREDVSSESVVTMFLDCDRAQGTYANPIDVLPRLVHEEEHPDDRIPVCCLWTYHRYVL